MPIVVYCPACHKPMESAMSGYYFCRNLDCDEITDGFYFPGDSNVYIDGLPTAKPRPPARKGVSMRKVLLFVLLGLIACIAAVVFWAAANPIVLSGAEFDARIAVQAYCKAVGISDSTCNAQIEAGLKSKPGAARIILDCYKGEAILFARCIKAAGVNLP